MCGFFCGGSHSSGVDLVVGCLKASWDPWTEVGSDKKRSFQFPVERRHWTFPTEPIHDSQKQKVLRKKPWFMKAAWGYEYYPQSFSTAMNWKKATTHWMNTTQSDTFHSFNTKKAKQKICQDCSNVQSNRGSPVSVSSSSSPLVKPKHPLHYPAASSC